MRTPLPAIAFLVLLTGLSACTTTRVASHPGAQPAQSARTSLSIVLNSPRAGLYTAAQPAATDWPAIAASGVTTVIDLRMPGELQGRDEAAEVSAAGMEYRRIPVDGLAGIDARNAQKLAQALTGAKGAVLVHCASGNRAGALMALMQAQAGASVEQSLEFGRASGMKGAEAHVREILQAPRDD